MIWYSLRDVQIKRIVKSVRITLIMVITFVNNVNGFNNNNLGVHIFPFY